MGKVRPVAVYGLGRRGVELARKIGVVLGAQVVVPQRVAGSGEEGFERLKTAIERNFYRYQGHILVCAVGIAVRVVGPLLRSKFCDPAVVVVDQAGRWAVSLVGGHLGGANELARELGEKLGCCAVITTATDAHALPALEVVAKEAGLVLCNSSALARVSGALVDGKVVGVWDPGGWIWPRLRPWEGSLVALESTKGWEEAEVVWVGWEEISPPRGWVVFRPRCLVVGVGCHTNVSYEQLHTAVHRTLAAAGLSPRSLWRLASIEGRVELEPFERLARNMGVELVGYSAEELKRLDVPSPSCRVAKAVGTPSVCEAAALLGSEGGELVVNKCKTPEVTVAVAMAKAREFG